MGDKNKDCNRLAGTTSTDCVPVSTMAETMKNLTTLTLIVLALIGCGFASPLQEQNGKADGHGTYYSVNFDKIFDNILPLIQKAILENGMDPQELPNFSETLIPLPGKLGRDIDFSHGWLQEMSRLKRSGPVLVDYEDKIIKLNLNLYWDVLDFNYRYFLKLLFIKREGDIYGRFHELDANVQMTVDLGSKTVTLDSLKFTKVGKLELRFEGRLGDKIRSAIAKVVTVIFPKTVLRIAEEKSFMIFQMLLEEMAGNLPNLIPGGIIPGLFP